MYISQALFIFLIIAIIILSVTLASVVISYIFLLMKLKRTRDNTAIVLQSAHTQALSIIKNAHENAKKLLHMTRDFTKDSQDRLSSEIDQEEKAQEEILASKSKEFSEIYEKFVNDLQKESSELFKSVTNKMEKNMESEVEGFKSNLLKQTVDSQTTTEEKTKQAYEKVEKQIAEYKASKLKEIDEKFFSIVVEASKEVLGKSLSMDEHRDLIFHGLEQVKRELKDFELT